MPMSKESLEMIDTVFLTGILGREEFVHTRVQVVARPSAHAEECASAEVCRAAKCVIRPPTHRPRPGKAEFPAVSLHVRDVFI